MVTIPGCESMPAERASRNRRSRMRSDFLRLAIAAEMDRLDGHRTADIRIDRMVHHAHGAAAQFPDDFIAPDAIHSILVIAHARVVP